MQAALGFVSQSANGLIFLAVSEQISLLASSDQMAPPFGNLQAFQEKGWPKPFTLILFVQTFFSATQT